MESVNKELNIDKNLDDKISPHSKYIESISDKEPSDIEVKYTLNDLREIIGKVTELLGRDKSSKGYKSNLVGLALIALNKEMIEDICAISDKTGKSVEDLLHEAVSDWITLKKEEATKDE